MAFARARTLHPLLRFLVDETHYGPPPLGLGMLFYTLYGQWRRANSTTAYETRPLDSLSPNLQKSVQRWREFLEASPRVAEWADRGVVFDSPAGWPDRWPEDWPEWVYPTHLHRAFGGSNVLASSRVGTRLKGWTAREGLPEVFAYVAGMPLNRKQTSQACRGARQLLQAPQFLVWAYNVNVELYPRFDLNPLKTAPALAHMMADPLAVEDVDVLKAMPLWMLEPQALIARARPFDPLRTRAADLVRYPDDKLLGRNGPHLAALGPAHPLEKKRGYRPRWANNRLPLYLTGEKTRLRRG